MGGLIKDSALTAFIIILNYWIYDIAETRTYDFIVGFIGRNQAFFVASGILGSIGLLVSASTFESLGLYKITYGISKILARVSQFLITFLAILNIIFYAVLGRNLMRDNGYLLLFSLALLLGATTWSVRITDFNDHTKDTLLPVSMLAIMSVILVEFIWSF